MSYMHSKWLELNEKDKSVEIHAFVQRLARPVHHTIHMHSESECGASQTKKKKKKNTRITSEDFTRKRRM